jgi:hypothetical protein
MRRIGIALAFAILDSAAQATPLRDPTVPPAGYGSPAASVRDHPVDSFKPEHLVTVDGRRYVMWRGHRYRVGDTVQGVRIERIEESAVWVQSGDGTRRLPLYAGIEKKELSR